MDTRFEIPPRLRLNRQASSFAATVDDSNVHATVNYDRDASDDGDDDGSTPRLGMSKMSIDSLDGPLHFSAQAQAQSTPVPGREAATPAERLRAVLNKAGSATPTPRTHLIASERTPSSSASLLDSDIESEDFETPRGGTNGVPATPYPQNSTTSSPPQSVARASLKSLFSHALRSPGGTPERPQRTRRGSMDSSIAEESPIKWSMMRAGEKAKRLSLSDDEMEKIRASRSGFADGISEKSFKSSQAATYDQLRERLVNSSIGAGTSKSSSVAKSDMTIDAEEATEVEQELFSDREAPIRSSAPPVPSSMSLGQSASQFPSQFLGSNLLTENSDMRQMIQEAQAETTDSEAPGSNHRDNRTPIAGPSSNRLKTRPSFVRERTPSGNSSVGSLSPTSDSRPTSRQSMNGFEDQGRKRELERGWNHPLGPFMERHRAESPGLSPTHSGGFVRLRKASLGSISGSESNDGRASPMSSVKRQSIYQVNSLGHGHPSSRYAGLTSARSPSPSLNQIRVSARTRTVSQPSKPNSSRSLGSSTSSNGTQRPLDRSRTVSLTAREISRPSSSLAHGRSPGYGHNGIHEAKQASRSPSPSSSRPPSRPSSVASSHVSEDLKDRERPHIRERNWNSHHAKWNGTESSSLSSDRRRPEGAMPIRTPPAEHPRRVAALHTTGSSPSSIPRPSVNGRSHSTKHSGTGKEGETDNHKSRDSPSLISRTTTKLNNGKHSSSSKMEHKARSRRERNPTPPRAESPTPSLESNDIEESEEHDTPKIGQQRIPDSPTPVSGSRPNSRVGTSSDFSSHNASNANGRVHVSATVSSSVPEKVRRRRDTEQRNIQLSKVSVSSEPIDFHESDLDSFQEEDIVASSSAPRVHHGSVSFDENDAASQAEESHADISVLRPRQGAYLNGHMGDSAVKRSSFVPATFSPPPSPPIMPSDPVTTTPQRRAAANTSKLEFKTPSPPKGMPALPDPPSSDEGLGSDQTPPVPITPASKNRYADVKTPRPPGAWSTPFATPAPAATARVSTLTKGTDPEEKYASLQDEVYTPPASYSRATSMIMKTPAPPGAWLATPATIAAKRLQQKVRFDEQETSAAPVPIRAHDDSSLNSDNPVADGSVAMKAAGKAKPPSPRTPGRIRVVDAFGNEITPVKSEDKAEKRALQKVDELHAAATEKFSISDSRKSRIRVLDAMGREIDEAHVQSASLAPTAVEPAKQSKKADNENVTTLSQGLEGKNLERKQALELLQKTIAGLKDDFNRTDDPGSTQTTDVIDSQITELRAQSIRATENRERLLRKIRGVKTGDPPSRSTIAWNALLYGKGGSSLSNRHTYFKAFVALVFLQMVIFLAFYRLTSLGARRLFLTTYIDPFYPELHLHITNPDLLQLSMTSPARSDMYSSVSPSSWTYSFLASWHAVLNRISTLRESVWDVWRDPPRGMTWPPT